MRYTENAKLPLRDGALMNYDLYLPDAPQPCPVILMRTPYTKYTLKNERIYANVRRYTDHGYAVMVSECRGTGLSEGTLCPNAVQEYDDGYDTVMWVSRQEWCDGRVGMFGLSYFGFTQLAAASLAPEPLRAICPFMTMAIEPFGAHMSRTFNYGHIGWIYGQLLSHPESMLPDPALRERLLPILRERHEHLNDYALHLPADQNPAAQVEGVPQLQDYLSLIRGVESPAFWQSLRHPTDFSRMRAPMLHCTGWFDACLSTTLRNWQAMLDQSLREVSGASCLVIGPWSHGGEFHSAFGSLDFGAENDGAGQDVNGMMLAWFDRHIKGIPNQVDTWPRVRYFVLGLNQWRSASSWPPAEAVSTPWYLRAQGRLTDAAPSAQEPPDVYLYDPMDPAPAYAAGPEPLLDYAPLGQREDVVTYATEPFSAPLTLAGPVSMTLYASTTAVDTDFTCRLVDVFPDGRELLLAQDLVRAKWRRGGDAPALLTPGETVEYRFEVGHVACCFLPGHRIKLHLSSALFPLHDRNLNTGEPAASCGHYVTATQTLFHDAAHPSCVHLPVIGASPCVPDESPRQP